MPNPSFTPPSTLSAAERRLRSQLHQLISQAEGLLHGSLIEMVRRCGKASCQCASDDAARHRSFYLGQTRAGKHSMEYIPKALEPSVRQWMADFQRAEELLEQLSRQGRARLQEAKQKPVARPKIPRELKVKAKAKHPSQRAAKPQPKPSVKRPSKANPTVAAKTSTPARRPKSS